MQRLSLLLIILGSLLIACTGQNDAVLESAPTRPPITTSAHSNTQPSTNPTVTVNGAIAYLQGGTLYRLSGESATPQPLADGIDSIINQHGSSLITYDAADQHLLMVDAITGTTTTIDLPANLVPDTVRWSPDEQWLVVGSRHPALTGLPATMRVPLSHQILMDTNGTLVDLPTLTTTLASQSVQYYGYWLTDSTLLLYADLHEPDGRPVRDQTPALWQINPATGIVTSHEVMDGMERIIPSYFFGPAPEIEAQFNAALELLGGYEAAPPPAADRGTIVQDAERTFQIETVAFPTSEGCLSVTLNRKPLSALFIPAPIYSDTHTASLSDLILLDDGSVVFLRHTSTACGSPEDLQQLIRAYPDETEQVLSTQRGLATDACCQAINRSADGTTLVWVSQSQDTINLVVTDLSTGETITVLSQPTEPDRLITAVYWID